MKKIIASTCLLSALASILWVLLYTLINDVVQSPFGKADVWAFTLFGPTLVFALSCLGYVRIRRSMDKEKIRKIENTDTVLWNISQTLMRIVCAGLNQGDKQNIFEIKHAHIEELCSTYDDYIACGGDPSAIPSNIRACISLLRKKK